MPELVPDRVGMELDRLPVCASIIRFVEFMANVYNSWSQVWFALQCMFPRWKHWELKYTRAGRIKLGLSRLARFLVFTTGSVGVYGAWKAGISLSDMPILVQLLARMLLSKIVDALSILHSRL